MPRVGEIVYIEGWDTTYGITVDEYELVEIQPSQIRLKHVATYRKMTKLPGSQQTVERNAQLLPWLDIPIAQRIQARKDELEWLAREFAKPVET